MIDHELKFKEFEKRFIDTENEKDYFFTYLSEARRIISDLNYFREHIKRTKTSKRFGFNVTPNIGSVIMDSFIKRLFDYYISFYGLDEDKIVFVMKLYDITSAIFQSCEYGENKEAIKDLIEWEPVLKFYSDIILSDEVHSFIGCSYSAGKIIDEWNKLKEGKNGID